VDGADPKVEPSHSNGTTYIITIQLFRCAVRLRGEQKTRRRAAPPSWRRLRDTPARFALLPSQKPRLFRSTSRGVRPQRSCSLTHPSERVKRAVLTLYWSVASALLERYPCGRRPGQQKTRVAGCPSVLATSPGCPGAVRVLVGPLSLSGLPPQE